MIFDRLLLILLAIFLFAYGIQHATNIQVVWLQPAGAVAALAAGVVCIIRFVAGYYPPKA